MNAALVSFGIQAVVRLGRVTNDSLEQWARDGEAIFPQINAPRFSKKAYVTGFFNLPENNLYVTASEGAYAEYWGTTTPKRSKTAIDALFTAAVKITAERGGNLNLILACSGATLVKQWDDKSGPVSPWARIILTAGDIVLEYVATNPGVLGGNGNGEKLIAAYAANLGEILPDDGNFGNKEDFAQRLSGAFLRAGLSAVSENPGWLVSESHVQELISSSVTPLVEALPDDITGQLKWRDVADAVMGPAASAALRTVAKHQSAFLGGDFASDKALGALTQALFLEAAEDGLKDQFTKEGLLGLYGAVLGVAAERPQLFFGDGTRPEHEFAQSLFSNFMGVLKTSPPPFDGAVGLELAGAALKAVGNNIHRFADDSAPWEQTAVDMVRSLSARLSGAIDANTKLKDVFSKVQLTEMGRIVLTRIAQTPGMALGSGNEAWEGVLAAIATAMTEDEALLLSGEDWIEIVSVAAEEAALNPGRLFRLDPVNPNDVLAGQLIAVVLRSARATLEAPDRRSRSVLYGQTLREAIVLALEATSGHPEFVREKMGTIENLVDALNKLATDHHERYGSREWLFLFEILLDSLLEGVDLPELTDAAAREFLKGIA